ncbi:MAG TPA: prephenate dehydratase, partial [Vampirovibrionales bacterium]
IYFMESSEKILAYLGPEGSYSHICALKLSNELQISQLKPLAQFTDLQSFANSSDKHLSLLPVENSIGGSVNENLDSFLAGYSYWVLLEYVLEISHCLSGYGTFKDIKEIGGHYQAFYQCEEYLKKNFPQAILKEFPSSTAALQSLLTKKSLKDKTKAAICSKEAIDLYEVPLIAEKINDLPENYTRFWLVGSSEFLSLRNLKEKKKLNYLTSLAFKIPQDKPGGLMNVLKPLSEKAINLAKIESRPTKGKLGEYTFFLDYVNNLPKVEKQKIIKEIKEQCSSFYEIGTYPVITNSSDTRFL